MRVTSRAWNFIKSIEDSDDEATVQQLLLQRRRPRASSGRSPAVSRARRRSLETSLRTSSSRNSRRVGASATTSTTTRCATGRASSPASAKPVHVDESYAAETRREDVKLIGGEAAAFGLRTGYVIPIQLVGGVLAAVSFGASYADSHPESLAELAFAANFAVGHLLRLRHKPKSRERLVTPRERECILWASEGKTDWEIAVILGISRPTVAKHLLSARHRLDVMNRAHLIGEAIRKKIIR